MFSCCCAEHQRPPEFAEAEPVRAVPRGAAGLPDPDAAFTLKILGSTGLSVKEGARLYCTCQIVDKPESTVQTTCRSSSADPVWEEEFELPSYTPGDSLELAIFDANDPDARALGRTQLSANSLRSGFSGSLPLLGTAPLASLALRAAAGGSYPEGMKEPPEAKALVGKQYKIALEKLTDEEKIGIDIVQHEGAILRVKRIKEGLIAKWNAEHTEQAVVPGDFIVAVNGTRDDAESMLEVIGAVRILELTLSRPPANNS